MLSQNKTLLIATSNRGKAKEIVDLLSKSSVFQGYNFITLPKDIEHPEETGSSFMENAHLKARHYYEVFQIPCLADDSGFCCHDLDGLPGIHSARWATSSDGFVGAISKVYELLNEKKMPSLRASFVCVLALYNGHKMTDSVGQIDGDITLETRGENGFGYDPIFIPDGHTKTFAEMSFEEKNAICHRTIAFNNLIKQL
jgi:XTP/dITP diphosphohydrolase